MKNIKLIIEYDGTNFFGWQYQPDKRTIQGEIEKTVKKITNESIKLIGAGRTDQGVHAYGQVANFLTESDLSLEKLQNSINALIGNEIYIKEIDEVPLDFHARFSAKSKIYQYNITIQFSPFKRFNYYLVRYKLNIEQMKRALILFCGTHDFRNFAINENYNNGICTINDLSLTINGFDIIITIEANRFLHKMVRGIVGFIIDIGRARFTLNDVQGVFDGKIKDLYFAPAHGLHLLKVNY